MTMITSATTRFGIHSRTALMISLTWSMPRTCAAAWMAMSLMNHFTISPAIRLADHP